VPYIINEGRSGSIEVGKTLDYQYPLNLDFKPSSPLHQSILEWILAVSREGSNQFRKRFSKFDQIERTLTSYVTDSAKPGEPDYIIVPQSAYVLDTILTHWITSLSSGPLFEYRPVGPEDKVPAMLAEILIGIQSERAKVLLNLNTQFRDAIAYGLGIVHPRWSVKYGKKVVRKKLTYFSEIMQTVLPKYGGREVREEVNGIIFEGNVLDNIDIRSYIPDPNVAGHEVQKSTMVSWIERTSLEELLIRERDDPDTWFNIRYLSKEGTHFSDLRKESRHDLQRKTAQHSQAYYHPVDVLNTYAWVIPKDKKLGVSVYPELWVFGIAGDNIIIRANPVQLNHNMIPLAVASPTFDGYSISPVSLLELVFMLQEKTNDLYSLHMHNLINAVSNRVIVDPWIVNYADVVNNTPGGAIKIREHMWGRGVQNAVEQLRFNDATANFMQEIQNNGDLMQRITGAVDSLQGIVRTGGERRSATEMRDTRLSALNRLQNQVRMISLQSMSDIGRMFLSHTQQFMQEDYAIEILGRNKRELEAVYGTGFATVSPLDIIGDVDVVPSDGVTPGGEFLQDKINIFNLIKTDPQAYQAFDSVRLLLDIMRSAGIKDATNMMRPQYKMAILPDEMAVNMAEQMGAMPAMGGINGVPNSPAGTGASESNALPDLNMAAIS
jgi:hypothetical protein